MKNLPVRRLWRAFVSQVIAASSIAMGAGLACTTPDENPATNRASSTDSGVDAQGSADGSSMAPITAPVCGKLGGFDGVRALASSIVDAAKADCRIAPIFLDALGVDDEGRTKHFLDCFQTFLGSSFQCPGITYQDGVTKDSNGDECESGMPNLTFSPKDWGVFGDFNVQPPSIVRAALDPKGLSVDELRSVASVFEAKRTAFANPDAIANLFTQCAANCATGGAACPVPITDAGKGDAKDSGSD